MQVVFRADASTDIGTGHVMRCLTLARALAEQGARCDFICRAHAGHLVDFIREQGFVVHVLPLVASPNALADGTAHAPWLGASQAQDAQACDPVLVALQPDWLVVDHYALDARWEQALAHAYGQLMVIDDLADRPHVASVLLDQTLGRDPTDYKAHVPSDCTLLCGSRFALLRPEFAALRPGSLQRRSPPVLRQLLITMGGVDKDNATGRVLDALAMCALPADCQVVVVMGPHAPHAARVQAQAPTLPWPTQVLGGVRHMAQLMANSDLAIGAAGATAWERCCLGLPSLMLVLADNQRGMAQALAKTGAAQVIEPADLPRMDWSALLNMGPKAAALVDGEGVGRVVLTLRGLHAA
ncbi:UDP-2,4-diacetamido-2,4,6-trideoxy-beta-L-altropyranose hydrolase [Limnohabitans sp. TS-CS-82]|uniref:UDP-2,4-diacetamido-2,4, 6-trideoxy-beta-L-altropyranose hydrolase n=1 Tax=Limnohabitans sp. TS-CS-82 TaxID=2094193 RepID=UPI000CF205C4|nr:UDP-2,4-diacetamido-2,4,6-trideoxy-beta-L-altropyranose hydrolase [Limnohabitans sp. TS-CS-82]PQA84832.1 UDP-2,4-diacetamido-2,4,6-trideoxy-beta-L-altropyranose hydrolase [Limnohabitans sp. TS-CS-82]